MFKTMRIYLSHSVDQTDPVEKYAEYIKASGCGLCIDDPDKMNASDGVFICISGSDNADAKAELNMALDRKLPVAYVIGEKGTVDPGLSFQLGLARKIEFGDFEDLSRWIGETADTKKKQRNKKVFGLLFLAAICIVLVISVAFILPKIRKSDEAAKNAVSDEAVLSDQRETSAEDTAENYWGDDLSAVKVLDLSNKGLTDISFLTEAVDLEELDISGNQIKDINVLVTLKKLKKVDISGNPVEDYTILDYMNGVEIIK